MVEDHPALGQVRRFPDASPEGGPEKPAPTATPDKSSDEENHAHQPNLASSSTPSGSASRTASTTSSKCNGTGNATNGGAGSSAVPVSGMNGVRPFPSPQQHLPPPPAPTGAATGQQYVQQWPRPPPAGYGTFGGMGMGMGMPNGGMLAHHHQFILQQQQRARQPPSPLYRREVLVPPVADDPVDNSAGVSWQMLSVTLQRSPNVGFGIAISGGIDNPHFVSGDPAIIVTDVVEQGPAAGLVQVNDRVVAANGVSLENVDYASAVAVMKDVNQLNMVVKRRVPVPFVEFEQRTLKFTLSKSKKKDDFGIVLGCKYYIKEITNPKLAEKNPGLKESDVVLRINGQSLEGITLEEATRWLQRSREKLSLVVQRDVRRGTPGSRWGSQNTVYERLGSLTATPRHSPTPAHASITNSNDLANAVRKLSTDFEQGTKRLSDPLRNAFDYPTPGSIGSAGGYHQQQQQQYVAYGGGAPRSPQPYYSQGGQTLYRSPPSPKLPLTTAPRLGGPGQAPEVRVISFKKGNGSLGIRVIGGNQVGIFVSAVQDDSPAAIHGIRIGDRLLSVNGTPMERVTREQAVEHLLSMGEDVHLRVESAFEDFLTVRNGQIGDSFFIRAHFPHNPQSPKRLAGGQLRELHFGEGDILRVVDTLFGGSVGQWKAQKLFAASGVEIRPPDDVGVIPNQKAADGLAKTARANAAAGDSSTLGRSLFRKRLQSRRTKSLTTTTIEDEFSSSTGAYFDIPLPAYERVALKQPTFARPVVLFGPLADVAKQLLLNRFALKFAGVPDDPTKVIQLAQVDAIMAAGKHAVLSISPGSVERLHLAQYAPIVVLIDADSRSRVRDLRAKAGAPTPSARKLIDQAKEIKKHHAHLLTATLDAGKEDNWFDALRQLIFHLQERRVWMPEYPPEKPLHELLLFPMQPADGDNDSLKGTLSTTASDYMSQLEAHNHNHNQHYQATTMDASIYAPRSEARFPPTDDYTGYYTRGTRPLTTTGGVAASAYNATKTGNSNYANTALPTYDPFISRPTAMTSNGANQPQSHNLTVTSGSSTSTVPTYDDTRTRLSSSPYQTPIRSSDPASGSSAISAQTAAARNLFFEQLARSRTPDMSERSRAIDDIAPGGKNSSGGNGGGVTYIDEQQPAEVSGLEAGRSQVKEHISGIVDWTGGDLVCPESGVALHVPENAIALGRDQHIFIEVCEHGPRNPPLSSHQALASPLVICGPPGLHFQVPVELRIPHNLTAGDPNAVIIKAGQGEAWTDVEVAQPPKSDPDNKFVSIFVKHF